MAEYSVSVTRKIHDRLKHVKQNNDGVTMSGLAILILDSIVYDDNKLQKFIDIIDDENLQNCGAIRLTERNY